MQIKLSYDAAIVLRVLEYETVTLSLRSSTHLSRATCASCTVASHTLNASGANSIHIDLQATATGTYWQIFEWSASNEHVVTVYIKSKILISISSNAESPEDKPELAKSMRFGAQSIRAFHGAPGIQGSDDNEASEIEPEKGIAGLKFLASLCQVR